MSQTREPSLDLDRVAGELASQHAAWSKQGTTAGPLTWRDAQAAWPQPILSDRSLVAEPESVGITMTTAWGKKHSSSSGEADLRTSRLVPAQR